MWGRTGAGAWVAPSVWTGLLLLAVLLGGTARRAEAWGGHKGDLKHQVEEMEEQWRTAQLAGDFSTLDRMLADDYVGVTMSGQVVTKPQQLHRFQSREIVLTRLDLSDMHVKLLGQIAVVTVLARVEGTVDGRAVNGDMRYTRVYHRVPGGAWKITNFEATHVRQRAGDLRASG